MPGLARIVHDTALDAPKSAKRERIPAKIAKAIQLMLDGECRTQKAAAQRVGLNASYLCEALKKPKIQAFIAQRTRSHISQLQIPGARKLGELIDAESDNVAFHAARHALALNDIAPAQAGGNSVNVNIGVPAGGYWIDLTERDYAGPPIAHPTQIEAKPLKSRKDVRDDE